MCLVDVNIRPRGSSVDGEKLDSDDLMVQIFLDYYFL